MKNKMMFKLNKLQAKEIGLELESVEVTIEVEMEPEVAIKNFALLTSIASELSKGFDRIVAAIKEGNV